MDIKKKHGKGSRGVNIKNKRGKKERWYLESAVSKHELRYWTEARQVSEKADIEKKCEKEHKLGY